MDKNKIHIDELVRNRLGGAEEREPAGAWSSMRDLLDKEMPVETAAFNWRRMLGYATAIILATSVSVGGYNVYRHNAAGKLPVPLNDGAVSSKGTARSSAAITAASNAKKTSNTATNHHAITAKTGTGSNIAIGSNTAFNSPMEEHSVKNAVAVTHSSNKKDNKTKASDIINRPSVEVNTSAKASAIVAAAHASKSSLTHVPVKVSGLNQNHRATNSVAASTAKPSTVNVKSTVHTFAAVGNAPDQPNQNTGLPNEINNNRHPVAEVTDANTVASSGNNANKTPDNGILPILPASGNTGIPKDNLAVNELKNIPAPTLPKDTIRQIEIVYHRTFNPGTRTIEYRKDTIAISKLIVDKRNTTSIMAASTKQAVPAPALTKKIVPPAPIKPTVAVVRLSAPAPAVTAPAVPVPQATAAAEAVANSENIKLVSLSQFRVASKLSNLWNAERFNAFVRNVKMDLSRAQFYAGMTGGLNASMFSASAMAGFQAGLTGLLTFNDQWSIAGELKFYQRFNTGSSIKDNYVNQYDWVPGNYATVGGVQKREWSWTEDTVSHSFNLTTIQTVELPLMLRYNVGRIFGEAGINLMYAFAVHTEEIDKPYGNPTSKTMLMDADFKKPENLGTNKSTIRPEDFNSRFGMGYVLGVGYQFTPALQMNFRMVQSVWDNANSVGAGRVSRSLYQTPSLQVSVGYRFRQGK